MSCKLCEKAQQDGKVYYYRWDNANIEMSACPKHIMQIFQTLNYWQKHTHEIEKGVKVTTLWPKQK